MSKQFFSEAKTLLSLFIEDIREFVSWFKAELLRQYHLAILKEIKKAELLRQYHLAILKEIKETYPTTYPYIDTVYEIVDELAQDENCPDFVEAPDIEDGLNEPDYPYDTEPSV